jgi:hypothetical protein
MLMFVTENQAARVRERFAEVFPNEKYRWSNQELLDIVHPDMLCQRVAYYEKRLAAIYAGQLKPQSYLWLLGRAFARRFQNRNR